jgi:hypothetical protein
MGGFLGWFVHHPLRLAGIAGAFLLVWLALRRLSDTPANRIRPLLYPAAFFLAFAAWEWLVTTRSPEADMRVDLLLIWPAAVVVAFWALVRLLRR